MKSLSSRFALGVLGLLPLFSCTSADSSAAPGDDAGAADPLRDGSADGTADGTADAPPPNTSTPKPLPVECKSDTCYIQVSGNVGHHMCGLLQNGSVRCWGRDTLDPARPDGALGRGVPVTASEGATPAPVIGLAGVTQISVGANFGTCARTSEGSIHCWGRNDFGQLGRAPDEASLATPTRVEGIPPADEVQLGSRTACAIATSTRALYCWGAAIDGLGIDTEGAPTFLPRAVTTIPPPVKSLSVGPTPAGDTVIAQLEGSLLATAGAVPAGNSSVSTPASHPWLTKDVLRSGMYTFVATDGLLLRWFGAIGGDSLPMTVLDALSLAPGAQIIEARDVSCALDGRREQQGGALIVPGRLFRWGRNVAGTLGVPPSTLLTTAVPLEVTQIGGNVVSFATSLRATCASFADGKIQCWGGNTDGELGRGAVDLAPHPEPEDIR